MGNNITKQSICIISFSPIARDARVLRQIKFLAPHYDLIVLGYGPPATEFSGYPGIQWLRITRSRLPLYQRIFWLSGIFLHFGKLWPRFYDLWYQAQKDFTDAQRQVASLRCHVVHANDWNTLPLAATLAHTNQCPLIFDAHEYAPLEFEERPLWRWLWPQVIDHILRKYTPHITTSLTVCQQIADRYRTEYSLDPMVILNAPEYSEVSDHPIDPNHIRLIHHGGAQRGRRLETMIEVIARCDQRFSLDFMLVGNPDYCTELALLANRIAPGRIHFLEPVEPHEIVSFISQYDLGFYLMRPTSYNNSVALPNKLFDFIGAGLGVCIGPSPAMAALGQKHGFTHVAPSFEASEVAATLNALDVPSITHLRQSARKAATQLNADLEMAKLVQLYNSLLATGVASCEESGL
jgi:hypothetical protein